jgi:hypothetical protein
MKPKMTCEIATGMNVDMLAERMGQLLSEGYQPLGGIVWVPEHAMFYHSMVLIEDEQ